MSVTIREAKVEDVPLMWEFLKSYSDEKQTFYKRVPQKIIADDHHVVIAVLDSEIVGYAWVQDYGSHLRAGHKTARFHDVIVAENMRQRGIGRSLLKL